MNNENILVFRGAIDDNSRSAEEVESTYLHDAILELAAGDNYINSYQQGAWMYNQT